MRLITVLIILIIGLILIKHLCYYYTDNNNYFNLNNSKQSNLVNRNNLPTQYNVSTQSNLSIQSNLVPNNTLSKDMLPNGTLPNNMLPNGTLSRDTVSKNMLSRDTVSNGTLSRDTVSKNMLSNGTLSRDTLSKNMLSNGTLSRDTVSKNTLSRDTVSKNTLSNNMLPNGTVSKDTSNNTLSTYELVSLIHDKSMISVTDNFNSSRNKPSFDIKDVTVGNERPKYTTQETTGYDNRKVSGTDFDNYPNQYDIINDNTLKSVLQNINSDTFMINENTDMYVSEYGGSDKYFELENKQVISKPKKILDVPNNINVSSKEFNLLGVAYNEYYNQYYLLYEHVIKTNNDNNYLEDNLNNLSNQIAEYILAKIKDNKNIEIIHEISPRNKINYNEVVYLSYGNFQLGPLLVKSLYNF